MSEENVNSLRVPEVEGSLKRLTKGRQEIKTIFSFHSTFVEKKLFFLLSPSLTTLQRGRLFIKHSELVVIQKHNCGNEDQKSERDWTKFHCSRVNRRQTGREKGGKAKKKDVGNIFQKGFQGLWFLFALKLF